MPRGKPTPVRSVRVPDELWQQIVGIARVSGQTTSDVVVAALTRFPGVRNTKRGKTLS